MALSTILFLAVSSAGLGFFCFLLSTGLWRKTSLGRRLISPKKRSPLRGDARILRPAGHGLRERINDLWSDLTFLGLVSVMVPFVCTTIYVFSSLSNAIALAAILGLVLVACLVASRRLTKKIQDYRLGLDGELATAEELNQLMRNGYHVFHDFPATEKFNIDHIVIGATGIFAVETKTRSKQSRSGEKGATVKQEGSTLLFPGFKDTKSVKQARDQARWLKTFLTKSIGKEIPVTPVLAIPGWFVERGSHDGSVLVYNPANGGKLITNRPTVLDEQAVQQAAYQVEQRCRDLMPFNPL